MRRRSCGGSTCLTSWASTTMRPLDASIMRLTMRRLVVLPQPEVPTRTVTSPSRISRSRSATAVVPFGKRLETDSKVITCRPAPWLPHRKWSRSVATLHARCQRCTQPSNSTIPPRQRNGLLITLGSHRDLTPRGGGGGRLGWRAAGAGAGGPGAGRRRPGRAARPAGGRRPRLRDQHWHGLLRHRRPRRGGAGRPPAQPAARQGGRRPAVAAGRGGEGAAGGPPRQPAERPRRGRPGPGRARRGAGARRAAAALTRLAETAPRAPRKHALRYADDPDARDLP